MIRTLLLAVCACLVALPAVAADLVLVDQGQSAYQIVIADKANAQHQYAARELAKYLAEISGVRLAVVREEEWAGSRSAEGPSTAPAGGQAPLRMTAPAIFVGLSASARRAAPRASVAGLGSDGLVIMTAGQNLLLFGGEPRGTIYAVYTFLEDYLGCRWWAPGASTIPNRATIKIGALNDRQVPVLEYREPFFAEAFDGDWAVKNKSNGASERLSAEQGGKITYIGFVHTLDQLARPAELFDSHPEWFAMRGGKRRSGYTQNCLTNEELKKYVTQRALQWLRENPQARIISISQNDNGDYCECPECTALDEKEGSHAGSLLHFVNYVAAAIAKEFPHVAVDTLAYQYTRKPPKYVKPLPNVIVRLCSIECNFAQPLTHPSNKTFYDDLVGWNKICNRLYIWDYVTNFGNYLWPQPNPYVLGPNVQTFVKHGVKGLFEQGSYTTPAGDMSLLKAWVLAKMLWDPKRDANALIKEFLAGYFEEAGPYVGQWLDLVHRDAVDHGYHLGCFVSSDSPFPSAATVTKGEQLFAQALAAVKGKPELEKRVRQARLPLVYVQLCRGVKGDAELYRSLLADIQAGVKETGMTMFNEGGDLQSRFTQWQDAMKAQDTLNALPAGSITTWRLPDAWHFALDEPNQGEAAGWAAAAFDDSKWAIVRSDKNVGWEEQGFPRYDGFTWYRQAVTPPAAFAKPYLYLHFGAVDEEGWLWVNGQASGEHTVASTGRPPERLWNEPFALDVTGKLTPGQANALAMKVYDKAFQGGIWLPVHLVASDVPLEPGVVKAVVERERK